MKTAEWLKRLGGRTLLAAAMVLFAPPSLAEDKPLPTYDSPEVGCEMLEFDYYQARLRAFPDHPDFAPDESESEAGSVARGAAFSLAMIFTAPLMLLSGKGGRKYDFSGDVADIAAAAEKKPCPKLLQTMREHKKTGDYPPSVPRDQK